MKNAKMQRTLVENMYAGTDYVFRGLSDNLLQMSSESLIAVIFPAPVFFVATSCNLEGVSKERAVSLRINAECESNVLL
jgi:hypothetical protein